MIMEIDINKIISDVRAASEALDALHTAREARAARAAREARAARAAREALDTALDTLHAALNDARYVMNIKESRGE
jgi:hypothetical protein